MLILLLYLSLLFSAPVPAEEQKPDEIRASVEQLETIERELKRKTYGIEELTGVNKQLASFRIVATDCMTVAQEGLAKAEAELEQLGEKKKKEPAEVIQQRTKLEAERTAIEARLAECTALSLRVQSVQENVDVQLKRQLEARMFARGPDIAELVGQNLQHPVAWLTQPWNYIREHGWLFRQASKTQLAWLIATVFIAVLTGIFLRMRARPWAAGLAWGDTDGSRFMCSCLVTFFHSAPQVLGSLALSAFMWTVTRGTDPVPMLSAVAYGLSFLFLANLLIRISLDPVPPGQLFLHVPAKVARQLARRLHVLVMIIFLGYLLVDSLFGASVPDYAQSLANRVLRLLFAINIIWVLWLFGQLPGVLRQGWFRQGLMLIMVFAALADLAGFHNLAGWLFRSVLGTLIALGIVLVLARLSKALFSGLEYGTTPWQQRARIFLRLPASGHLAGFFWLRFLVSVGLWLLFVWLLLLIWDISSNAIQQIKTYLYEGFFIGSLRIIPSRVFFALVALAVLVALSSWTKGLMKTQLESSRMERGKREALITMSGYLGVIIAIMIALGVAGIDFSNIAIIAGALSVGIGFGLQNIVNNFISGLILLFERPVKTGDWIVVGNTEGYVSKIRIRSTQIRTFDRADVIVPNSELISGQVTNWMLSDTTGRARIPIGVAYGTDTQKVKEILLNIADEHPDVLTNGSVPMPFVLFRQFGESSLDFELRCHVRNIDNRLRVISDINFAIDKAFREAGIVIPFPQRDVHIYDTRQPPTQSAE